MQTYQLLRFAIPAIIISISMPVVFAADSYEPDDTWGQAKYIANSAIQTRSIDPVGDVDWATFSIGQESAVTIETSGASGDTEMWLYDSSLVELEYNDDIDAIGGNYFSRIDRVCGADGLPAGTYYVRIEEYGDNDIIDPYYLTLTVAPCMGDWTIYVDDDAPNDPGPGDPASSDPDEDGTPDHPFDAIQEGIDAAVGGDIVMVRDGTYTGTGNRDLDYKGKAITVQSQNGPDVTIIDCELQALGVIFSQNEMATSILQGLTITHATNAGGTGAGITCVASSPTIVECVITECEAAAGAGITLGAGANAQIIECRIVGNACEVLGGGIACFQSDPTITGCIIQGNQAGESGGGIYCEESSPAISDCVINGNYAVDPGGGISCGISSGPTITNCTIDGNFAGSAGGAVYCYSNSYPSIGRCSITGNIAGVQGGGISSWYSTPYVYSCVIAGNVAEQDGGGIHDGASGTMLHGCTIVSNQAGQNGGGVFCDSTSYPIITNCILWADSPQELYVESGGAPTVVYCDVLNGTGEPWFGVGCIDADPRLMPMVGGVLRLSSGSPCIDAGSSDAMPAMDIEGRSRWDDPNTEPNTGDGISGTYWDIGAHEFKGWYANGDPLFGSDSYNGLYPEWQGGFDGPKLTIQAALDAAGTGDVVLVAPYEYKGTGNRDLDFTGKNLTLISESGAEATIINPEGSSGSQHRGFRFHSGEDVTAVVNGFMIRNGYAPYGGAIYCGGTGGSSPTIMNCMLIENTAVNDGGGMYGYESSPVISACVVNQNSALGLTYGTGGGLSFAIGSPTVSQCEFNSNTAVFSGGGVECSSSEATISRCTFNGNSAGFAGGGLNLIGNSSTVANCVFVGNTSEYGGAIHSNISDQTPSIVSCTLVGNGADYGGGVAIGPGCAYIRNCILWGNTPALVEVSYCTEVTYCDIQGGYPGTGNIDADPMFVYPRGGNFRLLPQSPCIDAGTSEETPETDMLGRPRHDSPITVNTGGGTPDFYDIGAHEFKGYFVNDETGNNDWNGLYAIDAGGGNGPKKTIQPAIDSTVAGDTVVVAQGTYKGTDNVDLDFSGKDITVMSKDGSEKTIIDCEANSSDEHRGFIFVSGESPKAVLKGFSIVNGYVAQTDWGGGMLLVDASPTIVDCKITNSYALGGGAITCLLYASPTIANCILSDNHALNTGPNRGSGGAMAIFYGEPVIKNCLITNNTADLYGGGIMCYAGVPQISNCTIYGNSAASYGGGILILYGPVIRDCIIWNNTPESVYAWAGSSPDITYSDVHGGTGQSWFGTGCIDTPPYFITGPLHDFYLCHSDLQGVQSPCVDAGSAPAAELNLEKLTTRTDGGKDLFTVDMGYHAPFVLRITAIYPVGNDIVIEWNARDMEVYTVQWSTDMENWNDTYVGETNTWTDIGGALNTQRYYRVRED